ncbi:Aerotolerance protein BatB / Aerotolerance protein BatC [hydrothermal vent metagenome]|uniref:Aerotolerance protein BatB / Aerotolerance protein BatC n=1 Tax=hydrothermal vent metagenome TaxID=652676 RepID=A0A3B0Y4Q1_9ZZZZ
MPEHFHFLQPLWLLTLIPLLPLVWRLRHATAGDNAWARIIDPRLQALLLKGQNHPTSRLALWLLALGWLLTALALANPVWEKQPQPIYQTSTARVIVLDLSRSMLDRDLKPSRLARARFKVEDILSRDEEGQTGLVVFAGDAFTVTPLTRDTDTIRAMLKSLDPDLMPTQGSRADLGLLKAGELLRQAGLTQGQILLLADGVTGDKARTVASKLRKQGYRVSVLGVGGQQAEPLTNADGRLLHTSDGKLIVPELETTQLRAVAEDGGGQYRRFSTSDTDINALLEHRLQKDNDNPVSQDMQGQDWKQRGPWLAVLLLPLAALAFRRGYLLSVFLLAGMLSQPRPVMAADWQDLWLRPDQQAAKALTEKDYARASEVAKDPLQRGSAEYKRGNYTQALEDFSRANSPTANYNRGNALAKLGRYEDAITAYDAALESTDVKDDALANKAAVQALLRKQQKQDSSKGSQEQQDKQSSKNQQVQTSEQPSEQNPQDNDQAQNQLKKDADRNQFADAAKALKEGKADEPSAAEKDTAPRQESNPDKSDNTAQARQQAEQREDRAAESKPLSSEEQMAAEQWLRRIPDDPGGLLRRKFLYQYQQRAQRKGTGSPQPW